MMTNPRLWSVAVSVSPGGRSKLKAAIVCETGGNGIGFGIPTASLPMQGGSASECGSTKTREKPLPGFAR